MSGLSLQKTPEEMASEARVNQEEKELAMLMANAC
jgi:hypothetical protein